MSGFVLHPDALTDLTEIWEYIAACTRAPLTAFLTESMKRFARWCPSHKRAKSVAISLHNRFVFIPQAPF
jgi:hypothetical protein